MRVVLEYFTNYGVKRFIAAILIAAVVVTIIDASEVVGDDGKIRYPMIIAVNYLCIAFVMRPGGLTDRLVRYFK